MFLCPIYLFLELSSETPSSDAVSISAFIAMTERFAIQNVIKIVKGGRDDSVLLSPHL
jgi:hypothetical protein